jgi:hypothetical protein
MTEPGRSDCSGCYRLADSSDQQRLSVRLRRMAADAVGLRSKPPIRVMADIINATPHAISVYSADAAEFRSDLRKHILRDGAEPLRVIPPSGVLLNAKMATEPGGPVEGLPTFRSTAAAVDVAPSTGWLIVSRMYAAAVAAVAAEHGDEIAAACQAVGRMLVVHNPVYRLGEDGSTTPVGCLGFERV